MIGRRSWRRAASSESGSATSPAAFPEFRLRYIEELRANRARLRELRRRARIGTLTLVYSAHDSEHNDAVVLAEVLRRGLPKSDGPR